MGKHTHGQQERRHARSKQPDQEENEHQSSLYTGDIFISHDRQGNKKTVMRDKDARHPRLTASGLSPQDDYVQRWLAQTTRENYVSSNMGLGFGNENVSRSVGPEGLPAELAFDQFFQDEDFRSKKERVSAWQKPRKCILESSSDCSFLEHALAPDPHPIGLGTDNVPERIEISKKRRQQRNLERSIDLEGSVVSLSINKTIKSFEKRRRHKTRKDRYEPKKALIDRKPQIKRQKRVEKRYKTNFRGKLSRNDADLMHQFSSKNVGLDRLTMRPSRTVGLFKNGRASSPGRRRGLPDLTFSEMGFLRRSKQRPLEKEEEKVLSKSRERERRRSERVQNEISEYFVPSRILRVEAEHNGRKEASCTSSADHKFHQSLSKARYQSSYTKSTSQSVDLSKQPLKKDLRHVIKQQTALPYPYGQIETTRAASDTDRNNSSRTTSYFTCSDSVRRSKASPTKQKARSEESTTPESIRRMLYNTGIFRYTGIDRNMREPYEIAGNEPNGSNPRPKPPIISKGPNDMVWPTHAKNPSQISSHSRGSVQAMRENFSSSPHNHEQVCNRCPGERVSRGVADGIVLRSPKSTLQHYSPKPGWQKHVTDGEIVSNLHLSNSKVSQQGISREVIAQEAYIKLAPIMSATDLMIDNANKTTPSANAFEAGAMMSRQRETEQSTQEFNAETVNHSAPLSSSEKTQKGTACRIETDGAKSLPDTHRNNMDSIQCPNAVTLDSPSEHLQYEKLVTGEMPTHSRTIENMPDNHIICQEVEGGLDQTWRAISESEVHPTSRTSAFEGLPMRGSWPIRAKEPISVSDAVLSPTVVEPLYSHQLANMLSHDITDQIYNEEYGSDHLLHLRDASLMEYLHDEEGELYGTSVDNYEFLDSPVYPEEHDMMLSNELNSESCMAQQEEVHSLWEFPDRVVRFQVATQPHSYEMADSASSLGIQQFPTMFQSLDKEGRHFHRPIRELVREEVGGHYEMNRFWQPRRQY